MLPESHENKGRKYKRLTQKATAKLSANLTLEFEFFDFVKQRLERQIQDYIKDDPHR